MSYAKFLLEQKIGRKLGAEETADHIDENPSNDDPANLQPLSRGANSKKSNLLRQPPAEISEFLCPVCGIAFLKAMRVVRQNQGKQGKAGPFCSKRCAGRYSMPIGTTRKGRLPRPEHGTRTVYRRGCRCRECRSAQNSAAKTYRYKLLECRKVTGPDLNPG